MKKWVLMFSVIALSNLVCAMEREHGDDWEQVDDNATQLVEDLINIKKNDEWEELDPMGTQIHGILTFSEDYPDITPTVPKSNPVSAIVMTKILPASNNASSIVEAPAVPLSRQLQAPSSRQLQAASTMPSSPIAVSKTFATSFYHMTSSLHASETSADDNQGLSYCHDEDLRDDEQIQQQKKQYYKKRVQDDPQEAEFDSFEKFLKYLVGLEDSSDE